MGKSKSVTAAKPRWPHQEQSLKLFNKVPDGNDFSDPGTGKTRVQIESFAQAGGRLLVVCPKTLMQTAWGNDIDEFAPGLTYAHATAAQREEAFRLKTDVVIVNSDGVKDLAKDRSLLKGFTDLVIDESTAYKNPQSQRTKAMFAIRHLFKRHRAMTGTPNPNSVTEIWAPMKIIDGGKRLGDSFYKFRSVMAYPEQIGPMVNHVRWIDRPGAQQAIMELIGDITIRHEFEKVMSHVPANHKNFKRFQLSRKCQAIYDRLEEDSVVLVRESVVQGVNAAVLRAKLLQVASGAVYSSPETYELIDNTRYALIADLVEDVEHSLVFFNWKHQRDELCKQLSGRGIHFAVLDGTTPDSQRQRIVKDYQDGMYQTLLMHPKTGAHGLTLTRGTTTILSSPIYEADYLKQTIHRIYRGGQDKATNTIMVEAQGTVEGQVYEKLSGKTTRMEDLLQLAAMRKYR